nr:unnamed protein product [Spirometra erinaceieuropaei]
MVPWRGDAVCTSRRCELHHPAAWAEGVITRRQIDVSIDRDGVRHPLLRQFSPRLVAGSRQYPRVGKVELIAFLQSATTIFAADEDIQEGQLIVFLLLHRKLNVREDGVELFFESQHLIPFDDYEGVIHIPSPEFRSVVSENQRLQRLAAINDSDSDRQATAASITTPSAIVRTVNCSAHTVPRQPRAINTALLVPPSPLSANVSDDGFE